MRRLAAAAPAFEALAIEGSLIAPAQLALIAAQEAGGQEQAEYGVLKGLTLRDEMARYFRIGQALFTDMAAVPDTSQTAVLRFVEAFLRDVLGFVDVTRPELREGRAHPPTLEALDGRVPVVAVPRADGLDRASASLSGDGRRMSAMLALQDGLNADEGALWGLACNGERLRLVRDNASLTRPAYVEADLRRIFEGEAFADFTALWLLLHASRFGPRAGPDGRVPPPSDCALERWREAGLSAGLAARDRLREGVEHALRALGTGFLGHPANGELRRRVMEGELALPDLHNWLLRLVYRVIFLAVAEDRGVLHPPDAAPEARALYAEGYGVSRLRDRAIRRTAWDTHDDLWDGLLIVFDALGSPRGEPELGLPALDGLFARGGLGPLEAAALPNRALMEAVYRLAWLRDEGALVPVNWRDMETEELGSVYESLLELTPRLAEDGRAWLFAEGAETRGNQRKTTGSYYTPDSLVQVLLDGALDPVLDRAEREADDPAAGLLGITVIDPACGSGHFLLAAARRIAGRVARARAGGTASAEEYRHALRDVARACVFGVDRNPMAVELTKVALWIETVEPGRPLGFLDANIRCGDALLGVFDLAALEQGVPDAAYKPLSGDDKDAARVAGRVNRRQREAPGQGDLVTGLAAGHLAREAAAVAAMPEDDVAALQRKADAYARLRVQGGWSARKLACDLYVAAFLRRKAFRAEGLARAETPDRAPTTLDVRTALAGRQPDPQLAALAVDLAEEARAFHWPLEFPAILARGGFDVVLGNPPWEVVQLSEEEYFAQRVPEIAELEGAARKRAIAGLRQDAPQVFTTYQDDKRAFEALNEFARASGRFDLTARGKLNTYALFAELFGDLVSPRGQAGVIVPTGVATDATTALFFASLTGERRLVRLLDFENSTPIFPSVHRSYKFSLLTIGRGAHEAAFAFFLTDPDQLAEPERRFTLTPADIARINPNSRTAPVFRAREDARLTAKIYDTVPVLIHDGTAHGNPWGIEFRQGLFNMTSDSGLFRTAAQLSQAGLLRDGKDWVGEPGNQRWLPLYEAKMLDQYNHRYADYSRRGNDRGNRVLPELSGEELADLSREAEPFYWVNQLDILEQLDARNTLYGYGEATTASTYRTFVATAIPYSAVGHKTILFFTNQGAQLGACLLANFNSIVTDYVTRTKVSYLTLAQFIVKQIPILTPSAYTSADLAFIVPRVLELTYTSWSLQPFARDLGFDGEPYVWDEDRRARLRADLDAWYARAYGLSRDELRYVLDPSDPMGPDYPSETFRVLKDHEVRRWGEYRTRRLVLEAWDAQAAAARPTPAVINWTTLPARTWARPAAADREALRVQTQAQLAAVAKALPGPTPADVARLAATYALEPRLLTERLQGTERAEWLRLVGPEAQPQGATVATFGLGGATGWGSALGQLRAGDALRVDLAADTWAPGPGLDGYFTGSWPGRAHFALAQARRLLAQAPASLSPEETEGVRALAA